MKTAKMSSKAEKLNWKPLKEISPVNIVVKQLKGQKAPAGRFPKIESKILIP